MTWSSGPLYEGGVEPERRWLLDRPSEPRENFTHFREKCAVDDRYLVIEVYWPAPIRSRVLSNLLADP